MAPKVDSTKNPALWAVGFEASRTCQAGRYDFRTPANGSPTIPPLQAQPPPPEETFETTYPECQEFLHPRSLSGYWRSLQFKIASTDLFRHVAISALTIGGFVAGVSGLFALKGHFVSPEDPSTSLNEHSFTSAAQFMGVIGVGASLAGTAAVFVEGYVHLFRRNELNAYSSCLEAKERWQAQLDWKKRTQASHSSPPEVKMLALPEDLDLGTTAIVGAPLTTGGSGVLDWVMMGLGAVGVTIAAPEIAIPRAAAAGWRLAAGAL